MDTILSKPAGLRYRLGWLLYTLLAASLTLFLLIIAGMLVRLNGAGLGCPDWPTCYGSWGLPAGLAARLQYAHRVLALLSGVLVIASGWLALRRAHAQPWVKRPLIAAAGLLAFETALGASTVLSSFPAVAAPAHLGLGLAALSLIIMATLAAFFSAGQPEARLRFSFPTRFGRWTLAGLGAVFAVSVSGVYLAIQPGVSQCAGWPLCGGQLPVSPLGWLELGHRAVTGLASLVVLGLMVSAWRRQRSQRVILTAATATTMLFFSQALIGGLKAVRGYPLDLVGLHALTTATLWGSLSVLVAATGFSQRTEVEEADEARQPIYARERLRDLFILTKPVIVALLLVTTYAGMVLGGRRIPSLELTFWAIIGGALAAGGSSAINQYIDRYLDRNMQRTARRPLAAGRLTPAEGLAFGVALCILAFFIMAGFVNLLAALLSLAGMIYYVLLYSIFLKKATVQNIVIGGGAGAIPPMVGWAAAAGSLAVPAYFLFAIVFLWTPPHFWALALVRRKDYARAGVPMMPVVKGEPATRLQIFIYTLQLVGLTLLMPALHMAGSVFLVSALALGGALVFSAWRLLRKGGNKAAYHLYRYSSMYLALIFVALVIDVLV